MMIERYYHAVEKAAMRNMILDEGVRLDGRDTTTVRPIWCETDYLPCAHVSTTEIYTHVDLNGALAVTRRLHPRR